MPLPPERNGRLIKWLKIVGTVIGLMGSGGLIGVCSQVKDCGDARWQTLAAAQTTDRSSKADQDRQDREWREAVQAAKDQAAKQTAELAKAIDDRMRKLEEILIRVDERTAGLARRAEGRRERFPERLLQAGAGPESGSGTGGL